MRSLSTKALGQPSDTMPTLGGEGILVAMIGAHIRIFAPNVTACLKWSGIEAFFADFTDDLDDHIAGLELLCGIFPEADRTILPLHPDAKRAEKRRVG